LIQRPFELAVTLFHISVLMRLRRIDRLALQAVVLQQPLVAALKGRAIAPRRNRGGQGIGAMDPRHAAQFHQGILQAVAEALEALGKADGARLPVRVGQHEVVDQVRKPLTADRHLQARRVCEVGGTQAARLVDLAEEDLLARPVQGAPLLDVPLQGTQLAIGKTARIRALQPGKQRLGLQPRIECQLLFHPRPNVSERVGAGSPGMLHAHLAGQLGEPAILARRLVVDAGLGRRPSFGESELIAAAQTTDVQVADHPKPPCRKGLRID
jgi:hypothetical protein